MTFAPHPSPELTALFKARPFQGQEPEKARILFLSSDANYSPEISDHPFFETILEYQQDGVRFWQKYGVHHPFLLDSFPFDKTRHGRPFHAKFSKLGLDSSYAEHVCFLELLDIPTVGNKSTDRRLFEQLISRDHLVDLDRLINDDSGRLFFAAGGVIREMIRLRRKLGVFEWLPERLPSGLYACERQSNAFRQIYHFSSSQIHAQLPEIRTAIDDWLR